ncbi:ead/Ea22-like family protein [Salmonella enterica subsp. enterica serovar Muenchen]|nr:ead/Ea22-like family protein [Salmonella enterica subsp. enterica serovar Muenchen]
MNIDKRALREVAEKATKGPWTLFSDIDTKTFSIHTPRDKRCENVIKWGGFDCQPNAEANAEFIAAFNPKVALALLDELDSANGYASAYEAEKWHYHGLAESEGERADRAEKRVDELESIATDYGVKFQKAQDALKHQALLHKSQMEAVEKRIAELDKRLIEYAGIATREAHRVAELEDENEYVRWRFKESDLLFAMLLITMRAAVIEKEHGEGDRAAMDWIINKLAGPGEFAPESETDAQAYFNRESEIIDSEFSACMDFFMKRNERLRATDIKVKEE